MKFENVLFEKGFRVEKSLFLHDIVFLNIYSSGDLSFEDTNVNEKLLIQSVDFKLYPTENVKFQQFYYNSRIKIIGGNYNKIVVSNQEIIKLSDDLLLGLKILFKNCSINNLDYKCWFYNKLFIHFEEVIVNNQIIFNVKNLDNNINKKLIKNDLSKETEIFFSDSNVPVINFFGAEKSINKNKISLFIKEYNINQNCFISEINFCYALKQKYVALNKLIKKIKKDYKSGKFTKKVYESKYKTIYENYKLDIDRLYKIGYKSYYLIGIKDMADKLYVLYNKYVYWLFVKEKPTSLKGYLIKPFNVFLLTIKNLIRLVSLYGTSYWTILLSSIILCFLFTMIYIFVDLFMCYKSIEILNAFKYSLLCFFGLGNNLENYVTNDIHFFIGILQTFSGLILTTNFISLLIDKIQVNKINV